MGAEGMTDLAARIIFALVPMLLSLTVHEFAHAWAAKLLGDDTAEKMGRMTLNPVAHIDPIGTLLLPIVLIVWAGGIMFGWAKPVPVNPTRFTRKINMRTGMLITAAAGPASNIVLATLCTAILALTFHAGWLTEAGPLKQLLGSMVVINVALAVFNLIPVGPLDGQKVLSGMLSYEAAARFERFNYQYGAWLMMGVIVFAGRLIAVPFALVLGGILGLFELPSWVIF